MYILNTRIDNLEKIEIIEKVNEFLSGNEFHQIATVNPEFILTAQKDEEFKDILNQCDLNVADGVGIWFAFLRFGKYLKNRIAGIDLMLEILRIAGEKKLSVFLVANSGGLSGWEETAEAIRKIRPNLKIEGMNIERMNSDYSKCHSGLDPESRLGATSIALDSRWNLYSRSGCGNDKGNIRKYEIVFCNFGSPHQEKFLYSLKSLKSDKIRLVMGVGGSFDYLTGKVRRAPVLMRKAGLEWLWRLIQQPKRIKRIWNAVIIFPLKIIFNYE